MPGVGSLGTVLGCQPEGSSGLWRCLRAVLGGLGEGICRNLHALKSGDLRERRAGSVTWLQVTEKGLAEINPERWPGHETEGRDPQTSGFGWPCLSCGPCSLPPGPACLVSLRPVDEGAIVCCCLYPGVCSDALDTHGPGSFRRKSSLS